MASALASAFALALLVALELELAMALVIGVSVNIRVDITHKNAPHVQNKNNSESQRTPYTRCEPFESATNKSEAQKNKQPDRTITTHQINKKRTEPTKCSANR